MVFKHRTKGHTEGQSLRESPSERMSHVPAYSLRGALSCTAARELTSKARILIKLKRQVVDLRGANEVRSCREKTKEEGAV